MDATGQLWQSGALVGKPVTFITGTASQGGGQEATILSSELPVAHFVTALLCKATCQVGYCLNLIPYVPSLAPDDMPSHS